MTSDAHPDGTPVRYKAVASLELNDPRYLAQITELAYWAATPGAALRDLIDGLTALSSPVLKLDGKTVNIQGRKGSLTVVNPTAGQGQGGGGGSATAMGSYSFAAGGAGGSAGGEARVRSADDAAVMRALRVIGDRLGCTPRSDDRNLAEEINARVGDLLRSAAATSDQAARERRTADALAALLARLAGPNPGAPDPEAVAWLSRYIDELRKQRDSFQADLGDARQAASDRQGTFIALRSLCASVLDLASTDVLGVDQVDKLAALINRLQDRARVTPPPARSDIDQATADHVVAMARMVELDMTGLNTSQLAHEVHDQLRHLLRQRDDSSTKTRTPADDRNNEVVRDLASLLRRMRSVDLVPDHVDLANSSAAVHLFVSVVADAVDNLVRQRNEARRVAVLPADLAGAVKVRTDLAELVSTLRDAGHLELAQDDGPVTHVELVAELISDSLVELQARADALTAAQEALQAANDQIGASRVRPGYVRVPTVGTISLAFCPIHGTVSTSGTCSEGDSPHQAAQLYYRADGQDTLPADRI